MHKTCLCLRDLPRSLVSEDKSDLGFGNSRYHSQPRPVIAY